MGVKKLMKMQYYTIGQFSKILNIPVKTIRYYDEIGLIKPAYINKDTNYRYYSTQQFIYFDLIRHLSKHLNMPLKEIKEYISIINNDGNLADYLFEHQKFLERKIMNLQHAKDVLNLKITELNQLTAPELNSIKTKLLPSRKIYYETKSTKSPDEVQYNMRMFMSLIGNDEDRQICNFYDYSTLINTSVGVVSNFENVYNSVILPEGEYLTIDFLYSDSNFIIAAEKLKSYVLENQINVDCRLIHTFHIIDISAMLPNDYITQLEVLKL
ncbi:MerR family transcriptional regulator [Clostridium saccharoperbutylacetonicum]|uniref:MerR family transcriptional regulator n=1 Tax=Clostridium saccharoperbutylacetonicum TaxID=36745 RepID=UPI0012EB5694|nr:helix-turn-helix domain-containing protein [Clostridium saccharoperbutylacetonicum]NSB33375.1 DNA-binding transcriptional MerR regulator [Clostridium saccharoperbutylacetonicum]